MKPSKLTWIREAETSDLPRIAQIYNESILKGGVTFDEEEFTGDRIQQWLNKFSDRESLLVLEQDSVIMGWAILKQYSDRPAYRLTAETSIYLDSRYQGQGYGQHLQQAILDVAQDHGYHHLVAKIVACNQASIRFHQQFGYELIGTQKEVGYSRGQWYDIAILQLLLSPSH